MLRWVRSPRVGEGCPACVVTSRSGGPCTRASEGRSGGPSGSPDSTGRMPRPRPVRASTARLSSPEESCRQSWSRSGALPSRSAPRSPSRPLLTQMGLTKSKLLTPGDSSPREPCASTGTVTRDRALPACGPRTGLLRGPSPLLVEVGKRRVCRALFSAQNRLLLSFAEPVCTCQGSLESSPRPTPPTRRSGIAAGVDTFKPLVITRAVRVNLFRFFGKTE